MPHSEHAGAPSWASRGFADPVLPPEMAASIDSSITEFAEVGAATFSTLNFK
jgi:hypothetical protein